MRSTNLLRHLLSAALLTGMAASIVPRQPAKQAARKPNVVFILGDDLGYCDTGLYGCREIPTPNIDSIAAGGVKFTNGYVTAPMCSPSRAGLMTGRYQHRYGFEFNAGPLQRALAEPEMGLPTSEITLAELMKKAGYATGMVGKWHLGMHDKFHPIKRGFDEYFGFLFGLNMYVDPDQPGVNWLYDLSKDIGEQQNVADKYPAIVAQLKKELADWEARMKPPMWPCRKTGELFPVVVDGVKLNFCI